MKLKFKNKFKSIDSLTCTPDELPNFFLITGLNGSGKSHLLEGIEKGDIELLIDNEAIQPIKYFDYSSLKPKSDTDIADALDAEREQLWISLRELQGKACRSISTANKASLLQAFDITSVAEFIASEEPDKLPIYVEDVDTGEAATSIRNSLESERVNLFPLIDLEYENAKKPKMAPRVANRAAQQVQKNESEKKLEHISNELTKLGSKASQIIYLACESSNEDVLTIDKPNFFKSYPVDIQLEQFERSFSRWFTRYLAKLRENKHQQEDEKNGLPNHSLTDEEFETSNGIAPWTFTNEILAAAKLPFKISIPSMQLGESYQATLIDIKTDQLISIDDISSGEKIILSLATAITYEGGTEKSSTLPKLILLDEIDAPLHPSMTAYLLSVLQDVLVNKRDVKVIMATHSPSTVALFPDESIFRLKKSDTSKHLQNISKDEALVLLTDGLPTLSISHQNRRQVFVESYYDSEFYEKIYEQIKLLSVRDEVDELKVLSEISLSFHSSGGSEKGNCDMVRGHVKQLRSNGNQSIFGIIDWDLKNDGNEFVKVLGKGRRHSIENYILDPLLVAMLLLRDDKNIKPETFGLKNTFLMRNVSNLEPAEFQTIADKIMELLKFTGKTEEQSECNYLGGFTVSLPNSFLHYQGHDLEKKYKKELPVLRKYKKESDLKKEILNRYTKESPELLPIEFKDLFIELTNSQ